MTASIGVMLCLLGCTVPEPTSTPAPTPAQPPSFEPPPVGTLRVGVTGALPHRDMHNVVSEWATLFGPGPSYGRLMRFTLDNDTLSVECDLCTSWHYVDSKTLEFELAPDARWQPGNNLGSRLVTPQDVVFSINRLRAHGSPHRGLLASVATVEPFGERNIRFNLLFPDPDLPLKLASPYAVIMAPEALDGVDARQGRVIGAGAWLFDQAQSGQVTLTSWDDHPRSTKAKRIEFHLAAKEDLLVRLLRQNRIDVASIPDRYWPSLEAEGFSSAIVQRQGRGVIFGMNALRSPFDDRDVRQAVVRALDLGTALELTFGIGWTGSPLPLADKDWRLDPTEELDETSHDSIEARPFVLAVANFGKIHVEHGEELVRQLRNAGFAVEIEVLTRAVYLDRIWTQRDFDAFLGPMPPTDSPNAFLLGLVHSEGRSNVTGGSSVSDSMIDALVVETDPRERAALARSVQRQMAEDSLIIMAAGSAERWVFNDRVEGFLPYFPMGAGDLWASVEIVEE